MRSSRCVLNHREAAMEKILRPQTAANGKSFDRWITYSSAEWQRVAAVQLTRYLSLETKIRQDLSECANAWQENQTAVYSIVETVSCPKGDDRQAMVGMITFHQFDTNPILYHCYLHPFFRGKGLMKKAWLEIQKRYPRFEIEEPISAAMGRFLQSVDCSHVLQND